jgi:hypothetical protein
MLVKLGSVDGAAAIVYAHYSEVNTPELVRNAVSALLESGNRKSDSNVSPLVWRGETDWMSTSARRVKHVSEMDESTDLAAFP